VPLHRGFDHDHNASVYLVRLDSPLHTVLVSLPQHQVRVVTEKAFPQAHQSTVTSVPDPREANPTMTRMCHERRTVALAHELVAQDASQCRSRDPDPRILILSAVVGGCDFGGNSTCSGFAAATTIVGCRASVVRRPSSVVRRPSSVVCRLSRTLACSTPGRSKPTLNSGTHRSASAGSA
jgi:hypothetical protein